MKYPWMPIFWGDFLANTMHLSAHEAGAYLFLIAHAWEHGGQIPGDPARLRRIAHVEPKNWPRCWAILEDFFDPISRGDPLSEGYLSKRVTSELQRLGKISNNRKAAALQMHSKSTNFASTSRSKANRDSSVSKQGNGRANAPAASSRPQPTAAWHPRIDEAEDYRAPPAKKSDNVLQSIPDKPERRQ